MPASPQFLERLGAVLPNLLEAVPTPFHIYDEAGFLQAHRTLQAAFGGRPFQQYFAVKALPNPAVLESLVRAGSGLDCSSPAELQLADALGLRGTDIVFTPNNVAASEYDAAVARGAHVTFDDRSALRQVAVLPNTVAFRVASRQGSRDLLMGDASRSKFGVPRQELAAAYAEARAAGARRFGIHGMTLANEMSAARMLAAAGELVAAAREVAHQTGTSFDYINFGGGAGIPYRLGEEPFDVAQYAQGLCSLLDHAFGTNAPRILLECGRSITGPHGVLVTRVVSRAAKATTVVGVDACMSALMRPGMYPSAYHHISVAEPVSRPDALVDVVGSLCENNDKFGIDRLLPEPQLGDVLLVHDCGAHGHAMGFNYNGRLRPAEVLLTEEGEIIRIRRAESLSDYLSTLTREPLHLAGSPRREAFAA